MSTGAPCWASDSRWFSSDSSGDIPNADESSCVTDGTDDSSGWADPENNVTIGHEHRWPEPTEWKIVKLMR